MDYKAEEWRRVWTKDVLKAYAKLLTSHPELDLDKIPEFTNLVGRIQGYVGGVLGEMKVLEDNSLIDTAITGLPNQTAFNKDIFKEVERSIRYGHPTALTILDGNKFKRINEKSYMAGNKAIATIGEIVSDSVRRTDTVYRWGGDEFCIICPETEARKAYEIGERIAQKLNGVKIENYPITVSQGIADYCPPAGEGNTSILPKSLLINTVTAKRDELFNNANTALHTAKDLYRRGQSEAPVVIYKADE